MFKLTLRSPVITWSVGLHINGETCTCAMNKFLLEVRSSKSVCSQIYIVCATHVGETSLETRIQINTNLKTIIVLEIVNQNIS
jgi:hypothetical protein